MTDQSPAAATPAGPATPGLRFRTPYRRAAQAPTAAAAYEMVLAADPGQDRSRMMLALVRRPDLDAKTLNRIAANHSLGHSDQWIVAMFRANKRIAQTKAAQQFIDRNVLPLLLSEPTGIEEVLIRRVAQMHVSDPHAAEVAALARESIGQDRISQVVTAMLNESDQVAATVASSPLLDDAGWDLLLARLPRTKKAARERSGDLHLQRLVEVLLHRPDVTDARVPALIRAIGAGQDSIWRLRSLLNNPHCPKGVYLHVAGGADKRLADTALASDQCPAEARFAAVLAGRPYAIIKAHKTIPVEVAHRALDDAHLVRSRAANARTRWDDPDLGDINEARVVDQVTRYTTDPGVMQRCLDHYLSRAGLSRPDALALFYEHLLHRHSPNFHDYVAVEPRDHAMDFLAGHPDGDVRALVVPEIHPEEFDAVRADPSEHVRAALATRQITDRDPDLGWVRTDRSPLVRATLAASHLSDVDLSWVAADPAAQVRLALATNEDADPAAWLLLAKDPDPQVSQVVGERILDLLARGESLPEYA